MKLKSKTNFSLLFEIFKGSRALYLIAFLFMLLTVFFNFLLPQLIRFVVDTVVSGLPMQDTPMLPFLVRLAGGVETMRGNLVIAGVLVVAVAAAGGLFNFIYHRALVMGAEGAIKRLRDRLYSTIQRLPYEWHVRIQTGDIIQRCTSDVDVVRNFISSQLLEMARTIVLVTTAYALLFPMNAVMALASFLFLPVIFFYSFIFLKKVSDRFLKADEAEGQLLSVAQETLTGVRVVRAFGRERYEVGRFDEKNHHFANLWMHLGKLLSSYWGLGDLITGLQMVVICVAGAYEASQGNITFGMFIVFLTYNAMIIWPVRGLGRVLSEASKTGVSLGRLREILESTPEEDSGVLETPVKGDIEFKNVNFSYENKQVLKDVSFTVSKGSTLGILGATGSGKTTLAHLLCRLYDLRENRGEITIGGVNINSYKKSWLRKNIGIVLQEPFLYSRTVRENVASLSDDFSAEQIYRAAQISCVHDAIEQFAKGYDTIVGERGVTLSGGQKQRVAIARAIIGNPPIMIFDDSLSAVDTETDAKIRAALAKRVSGSTTIIISHRITSLSAADKIIVMERGKIAEMGSPAELMERENGIYRRIHGLQQSMEDELQKEAGY